MVWEARVVTKGSSMRSRTRGPALSSLGHRKGSKEKLFALRRRFVVVVDAEGIAIKVLGNFAPWWSTSSPRQIVVKRRLAKIVDTQGHAMIIQLADEDKALDFATVVRDEWGVEPLLHTGQVGGDEFQNQCELEHMAALFMTSPEFRERVRQMHDCLGSLWGV